MSTDNWRSVYAHFRAAKSHLFDIVDSVPEPWYKINRLVRCYKLGNYQIFLHHILESMVEIENHIRNISEEDFSRDIKTQDAVVRRIEIIGEAVKNLPTGFKKGHPEVEWREIAGMRDQLIHHYFGIKMDVVWETSKKDLPKLKKQISKILRSIKQRPV